MIANIQVVGITDVGLIHFQDIFKAVIGALNERAKLAINPTRIK